MAKHGSKRGGGKILGMRPGTLLGVAAAGGAAYLGYQWWQGQQAPQDTALPDDQGGGSGSIPGTADKNLAKSLAPQVSADLNDKRTGYSHALLSSFQRAAGITADGKYGPQSAYALAMYVGDAPPPLKTYSPSSYSGPTWDGASSVPPLVQGAAVQGGGVPGVRLGGVPAAEDNLVELDRDLAQRGLARQILETPDGQERRYLVACFQRGERLPVTGQLSAEPETLKKLRQYAG